MLSRIAKTPLTIPGGVEVTITGSNVKVSGPLGQLEYTFNDAVEIVKHDNQIVLATRVETKFAKALSGTISALIKNMMLGVVSGFEKKLTILGVGYRVALQEDGINLNLALGYSHPIVYKAPQGITLETPTQTEVIIKGIDKQLVGQTAADIRGVRPVEPYKGKGVRYANEQVSLKRNQEKIVKRLGLI